MPRDSHISFFVISAGGLIGAAALLFISLITVLLIKNNCKLRKRKPTKIVMNLVLADAVIGILIIYCLIVFKITHKPEVNMYVRVVLRYLHMVSVLSTCCLSLDRYLALCHPLHYHAWVTGRRCCLLTAATWIIPCLLGITPFTLDCKEVLELESSGENTFVPWRACIAFSALYLCTWVFHGVMYGLVWREFWQHRRGRGGTEAMQCEDRRAAASARDLFFIVGFISFFTLPDMLLSLQEVMKSQKEHVAWPSLLLVLHQVLFMPLYVWRNPDFRSALTTLLRHLPCPCPCRSPCLCRTSSSDQESTPHVTEDV